MSAPAGSRPRGILPRSYARSIALDWAEYVAVKRFADQRGLAVGAALRELARLGLAAEARRDPDGAYWGALILTGIAAPPTDR